MDRISAHLEKTSDNPDKVSARLEGHDKATREAMEKMSEQYITMMEMLKR